MTRPPVPIAPFYKAAPLVITVMLWFVPPMSKLTLGIRRVSPIGRCAAVRRKRTYADKVDWAPLAAEAEATSASGDRPARPDQVGSAPLVDTLGGRIRGA